MSYSLKIDSGDLVQLGDQMGLVFGIDKLKQDIFLWVMERYGGDRFHVNMGSILQEFIGGIASESARAEVHAEIIRILQNYQALQLRLIKEHPETVSVSELLVSVDDIVTQVKYDSVTAILRLRNGSDQNATIRVVQSTTS